MKTNSLSYSILKRSIKVVFSTTFMNKSKGFIEKYADIDPDTNCFSLSDSFIVSFN